MRLLIFKVNQLGDNVVFLPVVQHLRRVLQDWHITVFTSPVAAPLYNTACVNVEARTFATASFNGAWRHPWQLPGLIAAVRRQRPDACLLGDDQGNVAHLLARFSGAGVVVGPLRADMPLNSLVRDRVPLDSQDPVARQNWKIGGRLLQKLGIGAMPAEISLPDLSAFGSEPHGSVIIHAGASRAYKRWPLDRFVALANRVSTVHPVTWVDQGAKEESALVGAVERLKPETLAGFIRSMAGARLLVGNNSGPMNIASALGIPGIILNGPSGPNWDPAWHRERFELLRDPNLACQPCDKAGHPANRCLNQAQPMTCMDRWSVDAVHERVLAKLGLP